MKYSVNLLNKKNPYRMGLTISALTVATLSMQHPALAESLNPAPSYHPQGTSTVSIADYSRTPQNWGYLQNTTFPLTDSQGNSIGALVCPRTHNQGAFYPHHSTTGYSVSDCRGFLDTISQNQSVGLTTDITYDLGASQVISVNQHPSMTFSGSSGAGKMPTDNWHRDQDYVDDLFDENNKRIGEINCNLTTGAGELDLAAPGQVYTSFFAAGGPVLRFKNYDDCRTAVNKISSFAPDEHKAQFSITPTFGEDGSEGVAASGIIAGSSAQ
jgi:hypothetical protein